MVLNFVKLTTEAHHYNNYYSLKCVTNFIDVSRILRKSGCSGAVLPLEFHASSDIDSSWCHRALLRSPMTAVLVISMLLVSDFLSWYLSVLVYLILMPCPLWNCVFVCKYQSNNSSKTQEQEELSVMLIVLVALIANLMQAKVTWEELPHLGNCQDQIGFVNVSVGHCFNC